MGRIYTKLGKIFTGIFFLIILISRVSAQLPTGFSSNLVQNGYTAPMGVIFSSNGNSMFTWDKSGHVYVSKWNGTAYVKQTNAVLNISDEVGDWRDFGLLSICLDPDFDQNGLIYLYYVVDRHHLVYAGTSQYSATTNDYFKATIGRVTRYRLNLGATVTTDYTSRKILIGESKKTGIPLLHESHMGGTLIFGRDKTLLLSTGDGASYASTDIGNASETYYQRALLDSIIRPQENVGSFRSQMINSLDGKILRFDPATGDGIVSNPFFDGADPRSPKSRVWAMGFRNPFRMSIQPNTGSLNPADADPGILLVGDVGWNIWEELNIINTGGLNFGWPLYEGEVANSSYFAATTINQDEGQQFKTLCLQPTSFTVNPIIANRRLTHYRPSVAWRHGATTDARVPWFSGTTPTDPQVGVTGSPVTGQMFKGNCAVGGLYYTGTAFGSAYQNTYFFGDYGTNLIKVANLNTGAPWINNISNFAPENFAKGLVDMEQNPIDGSIFYVNINTGEIMRISMGGNLPPVTVISSDVINGTSPLTVNFSSAGSVDPQGGALTYLWDFGDGTTSTQANPSHVFLDTATLSFTVTLTVTNALTLFSSKSMVISINNTAPTAKINNPVNNSTYSILAETDLPLTATVTDSETTAGMQYAWEVILRHNNHEHREPVITDVNPTVQISPIGCDGETYYYVIQLTVTDNGGLIAMDSVKIYPNCSTGGLAVSNLAASPQNNTVLLSWINPSATFDEVMVAVQPSTGFLANPSGMNYIADANFAGTGTLFEQGKIVYKGNGQSVSITNLNAGTRYYFRVFTRIGDAWTGGVETSVILTTTGSLTGVGVSSTSNINLSTEGTTDWAHWPGYDHKSTGGSKISNFSMVGNKAATTYTNDLRICSWNDGTPTASGSNRSGVYVGGIGNGFQITVPADLSSRTLKVYVGGYLSGGTLTAQLSDGSSPDYINTAISGAGQYSAVYTLTYTAASAGKLLTVKWVQSSGTGNVTLQAATLVQAAVTGITVNPPSASLSVNGTQQLTATIAPANAGNQNIIWSSNNNAVATVSTNGLVTALAAGTATITVTTLDGNFTATSIINCAPVTGVTVNPPSVTLGINNTQQLTATIAPANASNQNVSWNSSNNTVATVSSSGLVTALAAGTSTITVTTQDGNITASCTVTCTLVAVTGVAVNPPSAILALNGTQQLTAIITPANASNQNVSWSSSNNTVATVSSTGLVTALATGSATITVTTQEGNITANSTITCAVVSVTGVTVNPTSATLAINATQQLTATIAPANASNQNVSWSSSNNSVAIVSTSGMVTAIAAGNATITVTTQDGNIVASSVISVNPPGSLTGVGVSSTTSINLSTEGTTDWAHWPGYDHKSTGGSKISNFSMVGNKAATTYTNDLRICSWNDGTPTVSGSNRSGVYVGGIGNGFQITVPADLSSRTLKVYVGGYLSGGTLTAQLSDGSSPDYINTAISGAGQYSAVYTLTYTAASAGKLLTVKWVQSSGTGNVTLQAATLVQAAVTGITVNPPSASLSVNGTQQLTATIAPANAGNQNIIWSSNNNAVATVSTNGLVTALAAGTATITVTTLDGNFTATSIINCAPVTGVTVNPPSVTLGINNTQQLTATIAPANASNQNVSWNSSNNTVATVSSSGLVTALAAGTSTITVTTQDGNITASCTVTCTLVAVTGVAVNPPSAILALNGTQQLTAIITPANASNQNVSWSSSNNTVATVSSTGLVTALATGSATITVTTQEGNITANSTITCAVVSVTGVTVNPTSATLAINATQQLTATIAPANASNQNVSWSSSNNSVAIVSTSGMVTAIAAGNATITVTTQDGNIVASSVISVNPPGSLTGVGVSSTTSINLSTEGTTDWAHWPGYDHKSTGGSKISNFSMVGNKAATTYTNDLRICSWNDGTPTVSGSNRSGVYVGGIGNGFQITVPADLSSRTLKVYVGGYLSGGTLTAQLSDGSSPDYINTAISGAGQYSAVYTLTYTAASAGKLLTVKWVQSSGTGNVTLQAATLVQGLTAFTKLTVASTLITNNEIKTTSKTDESNSLNNQPLTIFPNPFNDNLILNYSGKENGKGTLILYNSEMRLIATYRFEKTSWNFNKRIAANGLTRGIYFVQVNLGTTKILKRLIKM